MKKIHILSIAPYPEFKELTKQIASQFPDVVIDMFTGNLESAISYATTFPTERFDAIISRGGTANILRSRLMLPVIEVEVSVYDMIRVLKLANSCSKHFAVVGYANIVRTAQTICEIMSFDSVKIYSITASDINDCLKSIQQDGIDLIVGDVVSTEAANKYGIRNILITSSIDSVHKAVEDAVLLCQAVRSSYYNESMLRSIINCLDACILTDSQGKILFSNQRFRHFDVSLFSQEVTALIPQLDSQLKVLTYRNIGGKSFEFKCEVIQQEVENCYLFIVKETSPRPFQLSSIRVESPTAYIPKQHFVFTQSEYLKSAISDIHRFCNNHTPVMIYGPSGTKKASVARYMHWSSDHQGKPFIIISCCELTSKQWNTFVNSSSSPINGSNCTVFFDKLSQLSPTMQVEVNRYLEDTALTKRHYIISSCSANLCDMVEQGLFSNALWQKLDVFSVRMLPLSERPNDIPVLVNLYIAHFNGEYGKQVVGVENDAMDLLKEHNWKFNLLQLEMVIKQLIFVSSGFYITKNDVLSVLNNIHNATDNMPRYAGPDLSMTLSQIEDDIIRRVLAEENQNHSAAAKRLGISRSTLWRKLH